MKKKITFLMLMIFAATNIYSQNYTITFDASGTTNNLDSVKIINLTHPDTAMWHNGDIFQLQLNNAINDIEANKEKLLIFPNPMQGKAEIMFNVKQSGTASINIYEITGKEIIHSDENLSQGNHQFQLSGLKQGAYFINIRGNGYFYSSKLISYNSFSNDINLKYNGVIQETNTNKYKTTSSSINFNFVSGDILQYTGYSANLTAVVTNSPTSDITVTFNFIASIPSVITDAATSITTNSAICGGNISSDGGEIVTARGICYATTTNPTITDNIVAAGNGTGMFTANMTGLTPGTTYYVRAFATNSVGTAYGNEVSFTTISSSLFPVVDIDGNGYDTIHIGTQIWMKQNLKTTHYNNGSAIIYPDTNISVWQNYSGAYAWYNNDSVTYKNTYGALYNWYAVNTGNLCPIGWHVPNNTEWNILTNYLGGANIAGGKLKEAGFAHWISPNTGATNETGFTALPGSIRIENGTFGNLGYYGRWWSSFSDGILYAYARNMGCSVGYIDDALENKNCGVSVRCLDDGGVGQVNLPFLTTNSVTSIGTNSAISGGNISTAGISAVIERGVCWSTSANPTVALASKTSEGTGVGNYTSHILGLMPNTTYYVRAYATNSNGTAYGNQISFTTLSPSMAAIVDYDGNLYDTVIIGTQVWMKQNLKTTHYKDGSLIPNISNNTAWSELVTGGNCDYDNTSTNNTTYGKLYNWFAVNTGNLCPTGWHVPSDAEWTTLITYLGGENIAGGKLKETGLAHWNSPNASATNETGFSAIPGGNRYNIGLFSTIGNSGFWWSSSESSTANAWSMSTHYSNSLAVRSNYSKAGGFSVRCIQGISPQTSLPTISTTPISGITVLTAISGGNISSDGNANIIARGVCWSISANPTVALSTTTNDGTGIGSFTSNITGLSAGTTYYVRAYATNSIGTAYGNEVIFTTIPASLPILTTTNISSITSNTAISGGNITSDGGASVTARGVCWSTVPNPHIGLNTKTINGIGIGSFTSNINGLTLGTTYYVRAYATNSLGTAYGNELSFTTLIPPIGTVIDYDGNVYDTVHIGTQVWLKQNLKTIHYKNGTSINYPGTNNAEWQNNTSGAYAWYNNDSASNKIIYGALYNWYAVNTGNLCPSGWHVPTDTEWSTLISYLGGDSIAGGKLKATTLWYSPNFGATNSSGFTALPGGARNSNGTYFDKGVYGYWWSSTEFIGTYAWFRLMGYDYSSVTRTYSFPKSFGFSVRCLKN